MWKILITTRVYTYASSGTALSVHTVVTEFDSREVAIAALNNIYDAGKDNYKKGDPVVCTQYAIPLF
jgi:hypothetical protein